MCVFSYRFFLFSDIRRVLEVAIATDCIHIEFHVFLVTEAKTILLYDLSNRLMGKNINRVVAAVT
jgi:hypothetical protein